MHKQWQRKKIKLSQNILIIDVKEESKTFRYKLFESENGEKIIADLKNKIQNYHQRFLPNNKLSHFPNEINPHSEFKKV